MKSSIVSYWFFDSVSGELFIDIDRDDCPDTVSKIGTLKQTKEILNTYYWGRNGKNNNKSDKSTTN